MFKKRVKNILYNRKIDLKMPVKNVFKTKIAQSKQKRSKKKKNFVFELNDVCFKFSILVRYVLEY